MGLSKQRAGGIGDREKSEGLAGVQKRDGVAEELADRGEAMFDEGSALGLVEMGKDAEDVGKGGPAGMGEEHVGGGTERATEAPEG
jgi:hypothetical protein